MDSVSILINHDAQRPLVALTVAAAVLLLYRDAEDPQMRNTVCCYKPECRAEWTSTEPEPEMVKTKNYGKSLRGLIEDGDLTCGPRRST